MQSVRQRILIVEDEGPLSEVLKERFENEGFDVLIAKDGIEGLDMALHKKPDLILLDIIMPKLGGLDMLKQLRAQEAGKTVPVVVLTNLSDSKEVHEALTYGARDFLVKADWAISDVVESVRKQLAEIQNN